MANSSEYKAGWEKTFNERGSPLLQYHGPYPTELSNTSWLGREYVKPVEYRPYKPMVKSYRADQLDQMSDFDFTDLRRRVELEHLRKVELVQKREAEETRARVERLREGFSNFLFCVAHAAACRAALRCSAGHNPFGTTPMSGECWNGQDIANLYRQVDSEQGPKKINPKRHAVYTGIRVRENPLKWQTVGDIRHGFMATWRGNPNYMH